MKDLVELFEIFSQLDEKRKDDCAIRTRIDIQSILHSELFVVVDLSIGNDSVLVGRSEDAEGLFALGGEVIDGQTVEADNAGCVEVEDGVVGSPRLHLLETSELLRSQLTTVDYRPNSTHLQIL